MNNGNVLTHVAEQNKLLNNYDTSVPRTSSGLNENGEVELSEPNVPSAPPPVPVSVPTPAPTPVPVPTPVTPLTPVPIVSNVIEKEKTWKDHLILPSVIVAAFILVTYTPTASYLEKYVPNMDGIKGIFVRAIILAALVMVTKYSIDYLKN